MSDSFSGPLDEELDRSFLFQRGNREDVFAGDVQDRAARDEQRETRGP